MVAARLPVPVLDLRGKLKGRCRLAGRVLAGGLVLAPDVGADWQPPVALGDQFVHCWGRFMRRIKSSV